MKQAVYRYQAIPSRGEMLLANDSSSFTIPFFEEAQEILAKVHSFPLSSGVSYYPSNASEDPVMELSRTNFHLSEWLFPALVVDENDVPASALLLNRAHPENVLVVSLKDKEVVARCFNGAEISEEDGEAMSVKEFLSTLSLAAPSSSFAPTRQITPANLGYFSPKEDTEECEDDGPVHIEVARPAFEPSSKKGTANLGSSYNTNLPFEDEEENDEPIRINVAKESFSASSGKKPRDLGSFSKEKKKQFMTRREEETGELSQEAISKSYVLPAFEPNIQQKANAPQAAFETPKVPNQRKFGAKKGEKPAEPAQKKEEISFDKPGFEPRSKKKPENVPDLKEAKNQRRYQAKPDFKQEKAEEAKLEPKSPLSKAEEKIYVFCRRRDIPDSSTIFNDPRLTFVARKFAREGKLFFEAALKEINASKTEFIAIEDTKKDSFLQEALVPTSETWDLLALNIEKNWMPYGYLLSHKEDPLLCAVYELDERGVLSLLCLTHNGVSVEDPNLDYQALRSLCFPQEGN